MKPVGKVEYDAEHRRWTIEATPHAMVRAKRLFAASLDRAGAVVISATEENSTDLLWFMERFPLKISKADLSFVRELSGKHHARLEANERLLAGKLHGVKRAQLDAVVDPGKAPAVVQVDPAHIKSLAMNYLNRKRKEAVTAKG